MTLEINMATYKHHKCDNLIHPTNYPFSFDQSEDRNKNKDMVKSPNKKKKPVTSLICEPPSMLSIFI